MTARFSFGGAFLLLISASATGQPAPQLLAEPFGDHAVLQRDQPILVWGRAEPGETVQVSLGPLEAEATAGPDGQWSARLPAHGAGGPFTLSVEASGGRTQTAEDVLVGDVFLCTGQSNMVWTVGASDGGQFAARSGADTGMRMVTVPTVSSPDPLGDYGVELSWQVADSETIPGWSAACYFMARDLRAGPLADVPVGMITAAWGGSNITAWLDRQSLATLGGYGPSLEMLANYTANEARAQQLFGAVWEAWWEGAVETTPWEAAYGAAWSSAPEGLGDWTTWEGLAGFTGMVWFRAEFELTAEQAGEPVSLALGAIDEVDQTWVNGEVVANTFGYGTPRTYEIPPSALLPGKNVVVLNVLNTWAAGGLTGDHGIRGVRTSDGTRIPLENWRYDPVRGVPFPPQTPWSSVSGLTVIHNAMVAPLRNYGLRGVVWYQGESNAGDGLAYRPLMEALIAQWRRQAENPELAALVVQLPNFGQLPTAPSESGWAGVREAQRLATAGDANAATVVTIDVGDRADIHPRNKRPVGERLARAARVVVYGENLSPSGAVPVSAVREGDEVVVRFEGAEELVSYSGAGPLGFELCGDRPSTCRYADARVAGLEVRVQVEDNEPLHHIRYAWADSPMVNFFDASGLPVTPFELSLDQR